MKCKDCVSERYSALRIEHPDWSADQLQDMAEFSSRRPAPNPGPRCATHHRKWIKRGRERAADSRRADNFGLTGSTYRELLAFQGGKCVCGGGSGKRFAVDHDHKCCPGPKSCGACVRGLLCQRCNSTLASYRDDPAKLRALADYLENPPMREMRSKR